MADSFSGGILFCIEAAAALARSHNFMFYTTNDQKKMSTYSNLYNCIDLIQTVFFVANFFVPIFRDFRASPPPAKLKPPKKFFLMAQAKALDSELGM